MPIPQKRIDSYDIEASVSDDTILIANKNGNKIRQNVQIQNMRSKHKYHIQDCVYESII